MPRFERKKLFWMCTLLRMWQGALALAVQEPRVQAASPEPSAQVISGQASGELGNDMDELLFRHASVHLLMVLP